MGSYYVVFHGKNPRIYLNWHECSKQVLGVINFVYKKYNTYEQALVAYQSALRDSMHLWQQNLPCPPDLPQDTFQGIPPADGKAGYWKIVLIISLVLLLFGIWKEVSKIGQRCCPS
jgi:hypothetical protein